MDKKRFISGLAIGLLTVMACSTKKSHRASTGGGDTPVATGAGTTTSPPCLAIVNGKITSDYPAVVRLVNQEVEGTGFCTGTFISSVALVTAAHCLSTASNGGISLTYSPTIVDGMTAIAALQAFTLGARGEAVDSQSSGGVAQDMAILIFPPGTSHGVMGIVTERPAIGSTVTSVGFGLTSLPDLPEDPNFDGSKHYGAEQVIQGEEDINIYTGDVTAQQSADAAGNNVINSFGDSGGPLIFNDRLAGTLSAGGKTTNGNGAGAYQDVFVDITSANYKKLIDLANKSNAGISTTTVTTSTVAPTTATSTNCATK